MLGRSAMHAGFVSYAYSCKSYSLNIARLRKAYSKAWTKSFFYWKLKSSTQGQRNNTLIPLIISLHLPHFPWRFPFRWANIVDTTWRLQDGHYLGSVVHLQYIQGNLHRFISHSLYYVMD